MSPSQSNLSNVERMHLELAKAESVKGALQSRIEMLEQECDIAHKMAFESEEKLVDTKQMLQAQVTELQTR